MGVGGLRRHGVHGCAPLQRRQKHHSSFAPAAKGTSARKAKTE
jgi:hypothetical protein